MSDLVYGLYNDNANEKIGELADFTALQLFGSVKQEKNFEVSISDKEEQDLLSKLCSEHIDYFLEILGEENVSTKLYDRIAVSFSRRTLDVILLSEKKLENVCDVVLYPKNAEEIERIVEYCEKNDLTIYCYNGAYDNREDVGNYGNVCIDPRKNYNQVVRFNEIDKTITVEAGMSLVRLEDILVHGRKYFKSLGGYTLRHFPIDYEESFVCDVALSGNASEMIVSQNIVETKAGTYIPTEVTIGISRCIFENRKTAAFLFGNFEDATFATRVISQNECGGATKVFAYDEFSTRLIFKALNVTGKKGCLLFLYVDGEKKYCEDIYKKVLSTAKKYGGEILDGNFDRLIPTNTKFLPFRDALLKKGYILDSVDISLRWSKLEETRIELVDSYKDVSETKLFSCITKAFDNEGVLTVFFLSDGMDDEE